MDDNNIGSLIVYLILAVIGIIGSVNKSKKAAAGKSSPARPGTLFDKVRPPKQAPPVFTGTITKEEVKPPVEDPYKTIFTFDADDEGEYGETYAGAFSNEGTMNDPLAERYNREGSLADPLADRFSREGNMEDDMAAAFAGEGVSSLSSSLIKQNAGGTIAGDEIGGSIADGILDDEQDEHGRKGFNLRKAVIYSEILNRKEYAF